MSSLQSENTENLIYENYYNNIQESSKHSLNYYYKKRYGKTREEVIKEKLKCRKGNIVDNTENNSKNNVKLHLGEKYKICSNCMKPKHIKEFNLTSRKYGKLIYKYRRSTCKICTRKQKKEYDEEKKNTNQ
jgi:hypothetical protein